MDRSFSTDRGAVDASVLDLRHLGRQAMGDAALERDLLELFAQHSIAVMARIEAAKTPADRFAAAHTLKGSARAVGAWAVAAAAADVEESVDAVSALKLALDHALAAIEAQLAARAK